MIIMNLRKIFGLQTAKEKLEDYKGLKERLGELDLLGKELAERFSIQKSVIDDLGNVPEERRERIMTEYSSFLKEHSKNVSDALKERQSIMKSLKAYREETEIGSACADIDLLENLDKAYRSGRVCKSRYFDIVKSVTGEPTKYADVVVTNKDTQDILVLHRVEDFTPTGKVCVPGGHVDPGEDFETAALRELKEETNLEPLKEFGIRYLGEHKTPDAHIKYYGVIVDSTQPVTVDACEHCFHEWIHPSELPLREFIFDQGKIVCDKLYSREAREVAEPLLKAVSDGRMTLEACKEAFDKVVKKAISTDSAAPLMPESMDGECNCQHKCIVSVRDPLKDVETFMKAVSGHQSVEFTNSNKLIEFGKPFIIRDVIYRNRPESNRLTDVEIVFEGDEVDMRKLLEEMRRGFMSGSVKLKTPEEEFLSVNELGTNYVGDPIFVEFERNV